MVVDLSALFVSMLAVRFITGIAIFLVLVMTGTSKICSSSGSFISHRKLSSSSLINWLAATSPISIFGSVEIESSLKALILSVMSNFIFRPSIELNVMIFPKALYQPVTYSFHDYFMASLMIWQALEACWRSGVLLL